MAGRIRSIKPEWIEDERFNACSDAAIRLAKVFYALVDDDGRCKASVRALGLAGWKFCDRVADKTAHAAEAARELVECGWLVGYQVGGEQFWSVRTFSRHQRISHYTASKLPAPPESSGALASPPETSGVLPPDLDLEGKGSGVGVRARPVEVPTKSPTALRTEALRAGYLSRFRKALPGVSPDSCCYDGNGGPWLELAREVTDEQVAPLLDAFFADADTFVAKDRAPSKLRSQRVRLLTQGPTSASSPGSAPTPAKTLSPERQALAEATRRLEAARDTDGECDAVERLRAARAAVQRAERVAS